MKITQSITAAQLQLIESISAEEHKTLLTHYGNDAKNIIKSVVEADLVTDMGKSKMVDQTSTSQTKTKDNNLTNKSRKNDQSNK